MPEQQGWAAVPDGWSVVSETPPPPALTIASAPLRAALGAAGAVGNQVTGGIKFLHDVFTDPAAAGSAVVEPPAHEWPQAIDAAKKGEFLTALGHVMRGIPVVGPTAGAVADQAQSGDIAGAVGAGLVYGAPLVKGAVIRGAAGEAIPQSLRTAAGESAANTLADVMSPKIGPNKLRFGNMAKDVAPALLDDPALSALSRASLATKVAGRLDEAESALDTATDNRLSARTFTRDEVLNALKAKRAAQQIAPLEGSLAERKTTTATSPILDAQGKPIHTTTQEAQPLGQAVTPGPNQSRAGMLDQAIAEVQKLGPYVRYDQIKALRQAYDAPAKTIYVRALTPDYLTKQGESLGAADVTGALREWLGNKDPQTADANANYHLYRTAADVLAATEEVERTRPKVGRQMMARALGGAIGEGAGGLPGFAAGAVLGPVVDSALTSGPTLRIGLARALNDFANGMRSSSQAQTASALARIRALTFRGAALQGAAQQVSQQPAVADRAPQ